MSTSTKTSLKYNYFPIPGRSVAPRACVALAGESFTKNFDFEVVPVAFDDWFNPTSATRSDATRFPTGDLPTLSITAPGASKPSALIAESIGIVTYIGQVTGFWPQDALEVARCIEILATVENFVNGAPDPHNPNDIALVPTMLIQDKEKQLALRRGAVTDRLKIYFGRANDICGSNGFAVGDKTTIVDFYLTGFFLGLAHGEFDGVDEGGKCCATFTNIKKIADRVMGDEKMKAVMGKILA